MLKRLYLASWIALPLILALIFFVSSLSQEPAPQISFPYKAVAYHFTIFLVLAITSMIAFSKGGKNKDFAGLAFLFSSFYAVSDEFHQAFVPGRDASFGDVLTDIAGITLGALIFLVIANRSNFSQRQKKRG